jgi:hypothetical protein
MANSRSNGKYLFILAVIAVLLLNAYTFWVAYPETYTITSGINASGDKLAKDFSAYYIGAWRLWNSPQHIYTFGAIGGNEPITPPRPQAYKYLPSFLLIVSPLLVLDYQQAMWIFDIVQFALLPLMAYLLYSLLSKKGLAVTFVVIVIALLMPFPTSKWGFSISYYWQWGEGQAKVFETFLILLAFYLGFQGKQYWSGLVFAVGFFDPRFGLLAIPLFLMYNRENLRKGALTFVATLVFSNLILLYPGTAAGFFSMVFSSGLMTPLYYYALIPFLTLLSLILVNLREIKDVFSFHRNTKQTNNE